MTTQQFLLMDGVYLAFLGVLVYLTRPTARRVAGALAGGAVGGLLALGALALGEEQGLWRVSSGAAPHFRLQLYLAFAISMAPTYLITWRVARRFRWRGVALFLGAVAVIGPPRDYFIAATFPGGMVFSSGVVPVLADASIYVGMVALGHAVMRLVSGSAGKDLLR